MKKSAPKPIELENWEIRTALEGRKTALILPIDPQPILYNGGYLYGNQVHSLDDLCTAAPYPKDSLIYVTEKWCYVHDWVDVDPEAGIPDGFLYQADWKGEEDGPQSWHPAETMPWDAARLVFRVTDVGVKPFDKISREDTIKAGYGIPCHCMNESPKPLHCSDCMDSGWKAFPIANFLNSWDFVPSNTSLTLANAKKQLVYLIDFDRVSNAELLAFRK